MNRKTRLGIVSLALGLMVATAAVAAPAKKLEVLPKGMDTKEVKVIMKTWTKALGVECKFCHDMDDMTADSKHKREARKMYTMQQYINKTYMKKYEAEVSCVTCHRGDQHPKR